MGIKLSPPMDPGEKDGSDFLKSVVNAFNAAKDAPKEEPSAAPEEKPDEVKEEKKPDIPAVVKKWNSEVEDIKSKLSLEDLVFNGHVTADVEIFPGVLSATFKSIEYGAIAEILAKVVDDNSGATVAQFQSEHSFTLLSEALESLDANKPGFPKLPSERKDKLEFLKQMNSHVAQKILDKYNQFDTAVKLLTSDDSSGTLVDKLKK